MVRSEIYSLSQYVDRLFDELTRPSSSDYSRKVLLDANPWNSTGFPPTDVSMNSETKDIRFEFALAGIDPARVKVTFEDDYLAVELEKEDAKDSNWKLIRQGIKSNCKGIVRYGVPFSKYDVDNAKATFSGGILTVEIPVREESQPKRLKIQTN